MPTLIGVFAWLNAVEIVEQLSATAPPACMNCLRSISFPRESTRSAPCTAIQVPCHGVSGTFCTEKRPTCTNTVRYGPSRHEAGTQVVRRSRRARRTRLRRRRQGRSTALACGVVHPMTRKPPPSTVPQSRLGRLARIGFAAGELAVGGAIEGLRRLGQPTDPKAGNPLFTAATARRLAERLSNLRGAAMKLGQLISLQGDDVLPPEFAQALSVLRSSAAPMPLAQLRRVLGREYGKGWERRFAEFNDEPIAAASIGQVHRARTRDGRGLALKIQYPGVAKSITSDVDNVAALLRMANVLPLAIDVRGIANEAKRQLQQEADYIAEGRFLEKYATLVADDPALLVPRVHWDLTTPRVLAMDFVEGVPLEEMARGEVPQNQRD